MTLVKINGYNTHEAHILTRNGMVHTFGIGVNGFFSLTGVQATHLQGSLNEVEALKNFLTFEDDRTDKQQVEFIHMTDLEYVPQATNEDGTPFEIDDMDDLNKLTDVNVTSILKTLLDEWIIENGVGSWERANEVLGDKYILATLTTEYKNKKIGMSQISVCTDTYVDVETGASGVLTDLEFEKVFIEDKPEKPKYKSTKRGIFTKRLIDAIDYLNDIPKMTPEKLSDLQERIWYVEDERLIEGFNDFIITEDTDISRTEEEEDDLLYAKIFFEMVEKGRIGEGFFACQYVKALPEDYEVPEMESEE